MTWLHHIAIAGNVEWKRLRKWDLLRLQATVALEAAADGKPVRVRIVAYAGGVMRVSGFGDIVLDLRGLKLPDRLALLADHEQSLDRVAGHGAPRVEGGQLLVLGELVTTGAGPLVLALLRAGTPLQASVGVDPGERQRITEGQSIAVNARTLKAGAGGFLLVKTGQLKEVSILPVAADGDTSVALAATKGTGNMANESTPPLASHAPEGDGESIKAERQRIAKLTAIRSKYKPGIIGEGEEEKLDAILAKAIEEGWDQNQTELELIRASRPYGIRSFSHGRNGGGLANEHLEAALMVRAGFEPAAVKAFGERTMEQSRPLHRASLIDLCKTALEASGQDVPHSKDGILRMAFRPELRAAGPSTMSMPIALGNTANKVATVAYMMAPAAWRMFAAVKNNANFKTHTGIRPTFAGDLQKLAPGGEIEHGNIAEETYTWLVDTYAKQVAIDRRDWLNDDVSVLADVIPGLARAAARALNKLVAQVILANSAAGASFWTLARLNYQEGAGTVLAAAGLGDAIELLRKMKDTEGNVLDLQPAVLLIPPDLEVTARGLLQSAELLRSGSDSLPTGNVFLNLATLAIEPRLSDTSYSGNSATAWYLFSNPSNAAVVVGFLDGVDSPTIETFDLSASIDTLTFGFRCYQDFGAALGDFRASIKSKGAA